MRILSIDTSTDFLTLGLSDNKKILIEENTFGAKSMGEKLQVSLSYLLKDQEIDFKSIDAYAVCVGPGSFTGLRIGIVAAKTFGRLYERPIIAISSLKSLAFNLYGEKFIAPILDARRNRVYGAIYGFENGILMKYLKDDAYSIEDFLDKLSQYPEISLTGLGVEVYGDYFKENLKNIKIPHRAFWQPKASSMLALSEIAYEDGDFKNPYEIAPNYLKPSQAEREKHGL